MLRESPGERSTHATMVSTKKTLQTLLLMSLVSSADALSLVSPIYTWFPSWLSGFSLWMVPMVIFFCILTSALVFMMPQRVGFADEPEPETEVGAAAVSTRRSFNKAAVYSFLTICVKRCLDLTDDADFDEDRAMEGRLNAIYDILFDTFSLFESDGITQANLRSLMDMHSVLQTLDSEFNAFALISAAAPTEAAFEQDGAEPECDFFLPPDPPPGAEFVPPAAPYEPHSPEHMAMWLISKLTEKLTRAVQRGDAERVLRGVEQRQIMVDLCKYCDENPEKRTAVWCTMPTVTELSDSENEAETQRIHRPWPVSNLLSRNCCAEAG
eukprot:s1731_g11.t1